MMTQAQQRQPLTLCLVFAVAVPGCLLKVGDLEAGLDDESSAESPDSGTDDGNPTENGESNDCLIGTQLSTVGIEQSIMEPQCEVVCAAGWGHGGDQLPIAWTTNVTANSPGDKFFPHALGSLDNGHAVVAIEMDQSLELLFFDPQGQPDGPYAVPNIGSLTHDAEFDGEVLYATHGNGDGNVMLSAFDIDSQQQLWTQAFVGGYARAPARAPANLAFLLAPSEDGDASAERELVMLDLDGNHQWTQPTLDAAGSIAFSPSGDRIAVAAERIRVYATNDGALVDEFEHGVLPNLTTGTVEFITEDRLVTVGAGYTTNPLQGWLSSDSLSGQGDWEQVYNRASAWCPDSSDDWATGEWFLDVTRLADGSVLAVGHEGYKQQDEFRSQPRIVQFTGAGQFLAGDRVLWDGIATLAIAGPDDSALVVLLDDVESNELQGFSLRKYVL